MEDRVVREERLPVAIDIGYLSCGKSCIHPSFELSVRASVNSVVGISWSSIGIGS